MASVTRLSERILVLSGDFLDEHMTVIATGEGLVVVDTLATLPATRRALAAIADFSREPVRYLINTHSDVDHRAGNSLFAHAAIVAHARARSEPGGAFFGDPANAAAVRGLIRTVEEQANESVGSPRSARGQQYLRCYTSFLEGFDDFAFQPPTLFLEGDAEIVLGDTSVRILQRGPGHTNADLIVHVPNAGLLVAGDAVMGAGFVPVIHRIHGGSVRNLSRVLASLETTVGAADVIVPGHGPVTDCSALAAERAYLDALWDAVAEARTRGLTLEEAKVSVDVENCRELLLYDLAHPSNVEAAWGEMDDGTPSRSA